MKKLNLLVSIILVFYIGWACGTKPERATTTMDEFFSAAERDSLLADMITYIYKRPRGTTQETKWAPQYRPYYIAVLDSFQVLGYHIDQKTGDHSFFLIRPARNTQGHKRGVLGRFQYQEGQISDFEEVLNTPMLHPDTIAIRADYLWKYYQIHKDIAPYYGNTDYVEFPNDGCQYNKERKEWRYDQNEVAE